jgi:hypothetical protein
MIYTHTNNVKYIFVFIHNHRKYIKNNYKAKFKAIKKYKIYFKISLCVNEEYV